ncbi:S1C family serine protease [Planococcus sp. CP5-4]|uniref:S1C family serine protease n=1 Tax=unclassified Planococcus (in: firmicutes) TaxID=2662419 RepID=UPI001C2507A2|nr:MULTISPECIES: S1C family serine protease [unclassified Planococcus (in: firmicutes)]MBU9673412.1 S1C family serine protease [Planococcus sp. CP5-4_YE]MBV0908185.1 S1C family serine protease [Planococcus sp. CP5-4_UN]MBW6062246.1 S1C family serine protease [Planococcus sp. CP5-4]
MEKQMMQWLMVFFAAMVLTACGGTDTQAPPGTETEQGDSLVDTAAQENGAMIANAKTHVYTIYTDFEQGSGFLYNDQGDILTNAHVVRDATFISLVNSDGQEFAGKVIGMSLDEDLALVRVEDLAGKDPLEQELEPVDMGTPVIAIGSPENAANTATEGEITETGVDFSEVFVYTDLYEMNALIKQGSSGGPLLDASSGKVLGINSVMLEDNPEIGYAIPLYLKKDMLDRWASNPDPLPESQLVEPSVKDAYFDEALLSSFIEAYYDLLPYSMNEEELNYYSSYLVPESQAVEAVDSVVKEYSADGRVFDSVVPDVSSVDIEGDRAYVEAGAVFNYHEADGETGTIDHQRRYTVVIDLYGDYQIEYVEEM